MKTNHKTITGSEVQNKTSQKYDVIKLGIDWHAKQYRVVRIIDNGGPEPAQRFTPADFLVWAHKQLTLASKVYSCYEAGGGGFVLHRSLTTMGVTNYVVVPRKLDRDGTGVQNDPRDARELTLDLDRYVRGNNKALRVVHVPTPEQEQKRQQSRQRRQMQRHRQRLATQGRTLLLSQGCVVSNHWWKAGPWATLKPQLPAWLLEALEALQRVIWAVEEEHKILMRKVQQAATGPRPRGLGALTYEELQREVCDWSRFKNRKSAGSYVGLVGGVSGSGERNYDLSITKAGNARLRALLVEAAWRLVFFQPKCRLVQRWAGILLNPSAHKRLRKRAIVAVARALFVDLWRWQTGKARPEDFGWVMMSPTTSRAA